MIRKVLIANRGEIAVRIARTLREMGIGSVAVFSDPDADAPHVAACDEAVRLEGSSSAETYLRGDRLIEIALALGADAVHPGYGFLSENAAFASDCAEAGLTFVGPSPEAIRSMGDKIVAKEAMLAADVPILEGWAAEGEVALADARRAAEEVGYPVLVKAAAGGGGKGMRVVRDPAAFDEAFASARREAQAAFGDDRVFIERYVERARHIEFQVLGDAEGVVHHLFERECSVQRRHQKIVEEAPSPALDAGLRKRMGEAAIAAARAVGYRNAGTIEFMLDDATGAFYFLEMNTRLQVEHPVTEATLGIDLVRAQIEVASGRPLSFDPAALRPRGHAIECRVYAEDADRGFLPSTGRLLVYEEPTGPWIRVDSGVRAGGEVTVHYDPMLAKVVAWAPTRGEAIDRMRRALHDFAVLGVTTNIGFLERLVDHAAFRAGDIYTRFLEEHAIEAPRVDPPDAAFALAALAAVGPRDAARGGDDTGAAAAPGAWDDASGWRNA